MLKKHAVTPTNDTLYIRFNITIWGKITQQDIANNYQAWIPETDFNCLISNINKARYKDIVLSVTRRETKKVNEQRFSADVWRALIYQR